MLNMSDVYWLILSAGRTWFISFSWLWDSLFSVNAIIFRSVLNIFCLHVSCFVLLRVNMTSHLNILMAGSWFSKLSLKGGIGERLAWNEEQQSNITQLLNHKCVGYLVPLGSITLILLCILKYLTSKTFLHVINIFKCNLNTKILIKIKFKSDYVLPM